jgi:hypothetical protein
MMDCTSIEVPLRAEQFRKQNAAAGGTAQGVV